MAARFPRKDNLMSALNWIGRLGLIFSLVLAPASGYAQAPATQSAPAKPAPYEPSVGQQGKDVVWVPTSDALVQKMLDLAELKASDYVIDLGSGDGRTVIAAAKRGATALGIEYNPDMVTLSQARAAEAGVADRTSFVKADLFTSDFSKATVLTMFLLPDINLKLRPQILDLAPGTRVVSNSFRMGDWEPDQEATISECESWCTALLWIVPAKVAGTWEMPGGPLTLEQQFQKVTGTLNGTAITGGKLRGDEIQFEVGGARYSGHVKGGVIEGIIAGGQSQTWTAKRSRG
jgi:SAM-dependent methyltransferase